MTVDRICARVIGESSFGEYWAAEVDGITAVAPNSDGDHHVTEDARIYDGGEPIGGAAEGYETERLCYGVCPDTCIGEASRVFVHVLIVKPLAWAVDGVARICDDCRDRCSV